MATPATLNLKYWKQKPVFQPGNFRQVVKATTMLRACLGKIKTKAGMATQLTTGLTF